MNSNTVRNEDAIYNDEIDLKELFLVVWKAKKFVILVTSFFALGSILYALSLTNHYKSEAVLNVAGQSNTSGAMSGLSGLSKMS